MNGSGVAGEVHQLRPAGSGSRPTGNSGPRRRSRCGEGRERRWRAAGAPLLSGSRRAQPSHSSCGRVMMQRWSHQGGRRWEEGIGLGPPPSHPPPRPPQFWPISARKPLPPLAPLSHSWPPTRGRGGQLPRTAQGFGAQVEPANSRARSHLRTTLMGASCGRPRGGAA